MQPSDFFSFHFVFSISFLLFSVSLSNPDSITLLSFKASLIDPANTLSSWISSTNPCFDSWVGVACNLKTHRVTRLVLENLNLTGSIHPLTELAELRLLSLKHNNLSSASNFNLFSWPNLKHLFLSYNHLSGAFPSGVSRLRRLQRLDLSYNYFSGEIPLSELAQLPRLLTLRLEANSFSGGIDSVDSVKPSPSTSILDFNVSNNHLSGQIPGWLSHFPASSFVGNENLCGSPLRLQCSNQTVKSSAVESDGSGKKKTLSKWVVMVMVSIYTAAIVAVLVTITCCCYRKRKRNSGTHKNVMAKNKKMSHCHPSIGLYYGVGGGGPREDEEIVAFDGCKGFSNVDELLKSSAEFLGKGIAGTTYKVVLGGGDVVLVVKRVRERRNRKDANGWLRMIGGLRHCNIVSLRAYYSSKDELLLVYDFLPNGSLHSLLHGNRGPWRTPLDWATRLQLASGSAQGLAFLHTHNKPKLFHGNLTSSNIIVDHFGHACISDIGLHQHLHTPSFTNNAYKAPELITTTNNSPRKFTQKCDVYSFGVILLEILTGKMPGEEGEETSLVKWVQRAGTEEWNNWDVFDFELLRDKDMEEEMVALMQVAWLCLSPLPGDRPKMNMVYRMIEDIRIKGGRENPNSIMNDISLDSSPCQSESTINFTGDSRHVCNRAE